MEHAPIPENEAERLDVLRSYEILELIKTNVSSKNSFLEKLLEFNTPPFNKLYLSNIQNVLQNILTDKPFKDEFYSLVGYHDFLNFHKVLGVNPIHFLMYATKDENDARKPLELKTQNLLR